MKLCVCDLCKKREPDAKIKYKYKATKTHKDPWYGTCWERIELCNECLEKIISAENINKEIKNMSNNEAINKLKDLTEGTIDHFDLEDAMDMLYEVKYILSKVNGEEDGD